MSMTTRKIDVESTGGKTMSFTIKTDLHRDAIGDIMSDVIRILGPTYNLIGGLNFWRTKLATIIIIEPVEYRNNEEKIMALPYHFALNLFDEIEKVYPFFEYVPSWCLKEVHDMWEKYQAAFRDADRAI